MSIIKKLFVLVVLLFVGVLFVGCEKSGGKDDIIAIDKTKTINVGILQLVTHDALGAAKDGFIAGLKEAGYEDGKNIKIVLKNPEADTATMNQMAEELVRTCDIVLAIATPAATAVQTAAETTGRKIPILFTAVTDAVEAQLVESNEKPGGRITGTSDINPVTDQIDLLKELLPSATKFGILYNISEVNSQVQARLAKEEGAKQGLTAIEKTATDAASLPSVVQQLINDGVSAIYLPTDNLIASNMPAVVEKCEAAKIPTICGEGGMVDNGGTITYGINYFNLGKQTAAMAVKIFDGTKPSKLPVETQPADKLEITANMESLRQMGIELPESIRNRMK